MVNQNVAKGKVLISDPFLWDSNFERSVVYLVEHNEEGSLGLVLNYPLEEALNSKLKAEVGIGSDFYQGGPVELNTLHFLHQNDTIEDAQKIQEGVYWGGNLNQAIETLDLLPHLKNEYKFFLGYSGWAAGQLQEELQENTWIVSDIHQDFIFGKTLESQTFWSEMMKKQGADWRLLSNAPKNYFLN